MSAPAEDELMGQARELAAKLGEIPSRDRIKTALGIGSGRASAILARLRDEQDEPGTPEGAHQTAEDATVTTAELDALIEQTRARIADEWRPQLARTSEPVPLAAEDEPPEPDPERADEDEQPPEPVPEPSRPSRVPGVWPLWLIALPAFVAIWSGWVGLGELTGFGMVRPLPGIADGWRINTAVVLPIGVEVYAAYALRIWLGGRVPERARRFARTSAIGSLGLGAAGQVAYHLMAAAGMSAAPWQITALVACLPVTVLGMAAGLAHLVRGGEQ